MLASLNGFNNVPKCISGEGYVKWYIVFIYLVKFISKTTGTGTFYVEKIIMMNLIYLISMEQFKLFFE